MSGWYKDKNGTWWSPKQRSESAKKTRQAIKDGLYTPKGVCQRCGQNEGRIDRHNHDYSHPYKFLEEVCYRCHMMIHMEYRAPEQVAEYFRQVEAGRQWPATMSIAVVCRDHSIPPKQKSAVDRPSKEAEPVDHPHLKPEDKPAEPDAPLFM